MKSLITMMRTAAFVLAVLVMWGHVAMADQGVETVGKGEINWVQYRVTAQGFGAAPPRAQNIAQARLLAQRAAVVDARRNLLEVVKGVRIDSRTLVENMMVSADVTVTKVEGVLKNAAVDKLEYLADGSATATVSMPLSGELGQVLLSAAPPIEGGPQAAAGDEGLASQVRSLEQRVDRLEQMVLNLKKTNVEARDALELMRLVASAWRQWAEQARPLLTPAASTTSIERDLNKQQQEIAALNRKIDDLASRLARIEGEAAPASAAAGPKEKFTGLVVDASRVSGFQPSMRPKLLGDNKRMIYPGPGVNPARSAIRGYVRYYRNLGQAQQSDRAGALPYTTRATGTYRMRSNLVLDAKATGLLKEIMEAPQNFLDDCKVVIAF